MVVKAAACVADRPLTWVVVNPALTCVEVKAPTWPVVRALTCVVVRTETWLVVRLATWLVFKIGRASCRERVWS